MGVGSYFSCGQVHESDASDPTNQFHLFYKKWKDKKAYFISLKKKPISFTIFIFIFIFTFLARSQTMFLHEKEPTLDSCLLWKEGTLKGLLMNKDTHNKKKEKDIFIVLS